MPAVDVAMERSLRRGFLDLFVASLRPALERRDIAGQISDVKTAFSSWDNCMQAAYCKWPAIALIIIGGLIIFSVVWCIVRCACCGLSCCCSCFSCLKCCGNCCGCCDPPRGSRHKYLDEPYIPPNHGYKSQEPMHAGFGGPTVPAAAKGPQFAQFAEFDMGGKKNEDALPQMPSWEGAEHKKVLVEEEAVEMDALKKPEAGGQAAGAAAMNRAPGAASPAGQRSPVNRSPYGPPAAGSDGFFAASALGNNDPYAQGAPAYNQPGMAYSEPGQGYGMAGRTMSPGPRSPRAYNNGGFNDGYNNTGYGQSQDYHATAGQGSYDNYNGATQHQPYDNYDTYNNPPANQGYRHGPPHEMDATPSYPPQSRRSPAPQAGPYGSESRRSPAPQAGPYGPEARRSPAPQGPYGNSNDAYGRRSPAASQGQYGAAYAAGDSRRSPAPQGDYTRRGSPAPQGDYARRGSPAPQGDYARRSPAPQGSDYNSNNSNRSGAGYDTRPYGRAPPQRQYSSSSAAQNNGTGNGGMQAASSPLRNEAGFDFNFSSSGYSRPPAATASSPVGGNGGGYRQPSPTAEGQGNGQGGYPGYKPYQPAA